ncbi:MAG: class I SAM-dependent methyltransferase [Prochloraceae cyanobacterium]|nr:class I SAM-dependent methyltransferase [Prochloraceae cyanobacterium]
MKTTKQSEKLNISRFIEDRELQPDVSAERVNPLALKIANAVRTIAAEAYINGLEIPDSLCFKILKNSIAIAYEKFPSLLVTYDWVAKESDRLAEGSQELMDIQYNLSGEMFKLMLGESQLMYPKYSMALWEKGASNLEQAQIAMLDDLIEKVGIQDGDEILDIGCGWGSAANYILQKFPNARVTGLNLSHEQCQYIRQQINNSNNSLSWDRFTLCEVDLNQVVFARKFDKIISLGTFEHVGNLTKSFEKVASFLKPEGKVLIHIISTRLPNNIWSPFMQKYIFPYARVWQYDVIPNCNKHLKTVNKWYINGLNYARTLRAWLENFDRHQDIIKTLDFGQDYAKFRRIWRFYLILCAAYFEAGEGKFLGNGQYLMIPQQ